METTFPLLGIRAFHRAGLRVCLDLHHRTISVWSPGTWVRNAARFLRRAPGRFARLTLNDLREDAWF
jgi:hypothetical protein